MLRLETLREVIGNGGTLELRVTFGKADTDPVEVIVVPVPGAAKVADSTVEAALQMPLYLCGTLEELEDGLEAALRKFARARRGLEEAAGDAVAALRAATAEAQQAKAAKEKGDASASCARVAADGEAAEDVTPKDTKASAPEPAPAPAGTVQSLF